MAIASLVLGVMSIMCSMCLPGFQCFGVILAVVGLITAGKNKEHDKASVAKAGKVCSIVGLILCVVLLAIYFLCLNIVTSVFTTGFFGELAELVRELHGSWSA